MANNKPIRARNSLELAQAFGLSESESHSWEVQQQLYRSLLDVVRETSLTHEQVAKKAGTSRTRITAILNGNLRHVSTDLLVRILGSLGFLVRVNVTKARRSA